MEESGGDRDSRKVSPVGWLGFLILFVGGLIVWDYFTQDAKNWMTYVYLAAGFAGAALLIFVFGLLRPR